MDAAECRRRVAASRVARLATVDAEGRPHIVPFTFAVDGDVILSAVDQKPKSTRRLRRLENIERNPRVSVLVDHYSDDWSELWWVRVDGTAEVVPSGSVFEDAVRMLADRYEQYRRDRPAGPVIAVRAEHWRGWTAS